MNAKKVDRETFDIIYNLLLNVEWLKSKSDALVELYNLCDTIDQQLLVVDLLKRFIYVDNTYLDKCGNDIASHITKKWNLNSSDTIIVATADADKGEVDGSHAMLQRIKNKFVKYNWTSDNFIGSIGKGVYNIKENQTAILFDDFIGTGNTIRRKYKWFVQQLNNRKLENVSIKVISIASMEFAYLELCQESIDVYSPILLKKGISEYYEYNKINKHITEMKDIEKKLEEKHFHYRLNNYSLGYKQSETLFAIESLNIPNNVFPIFWWPYQKENLRRDTLFQRMN